MHTHTATEKSASPVPECCGSSWQSMRNTAAGVFSIPVSNVDSLRHAVAAAAQAAGHPFRDEDTPVVALDPAGRPVFGGPALAEITAPEAFVIVANAT